MLKSKKNHPYAKPFLKWAGGKRGLIEQLFKKFPTEFNNWFGNRNLCCGCFCKLLIQ
jgi:hypothetical protein